MAESVYSLQAWRERSLSRSLAKVPRIEFFQQRDRLVLIIHVAGPVIEEFLELRSQSGKLGIVAEIRGVRPKRLKLGIVENQGSRNLGKRPDLPVADLLPRVAFS